MKGFTVVISLVLLSASNSFAKGLELSFPGQVSPAATKLLIKSWPKVKTAFPGLDKYSDSLSIVSIEDTLKVQDVEYRKVTVELLVPTGRSSIPSEFKALGQHCFLDIDVNGQNVSVSKRPCKAVCLGRKVLGTEHDNGDVLKVRLQ